MQGTCNKTQKNIIKQQVPSEDLVGARQRFYVQIMEMRTWEKDFVVSSDFFVVKEKPKEQE